VACRQMATDSELLAGLNVGDETPDGASWVSVWTTQDETVTPPESARLEGALNLTVQSVCADAQVRHTDLPRSPLVQQIVLAQLAAGDPVPLGPADCARLSG
jgi:triacylglycerol lipase